MSSLEHIEKLLNEQGSKPPIDKWHPDLSGDIDIQICADGRWIHEGGEIKRHELVKLFASILRRESDDEYYLVTPVEKWRVQVEDLPLIIVDMEAVKSADDTQLRIAVKTNVGDWHELSRDHPLIVEQGADDEPRPAVLTRHGLWARVNRACFYRLVELGENRGNELVLHSGGEVFVLGKIE